MAGHSTEADTIQIEIFLPDFLTMPLWQKWAKARREKSLETDPITYEFDLALLIVESGNFTLNGTTYDIKDVEHMPASVAAWVGTYVLNWINSERSVEKKLLNLPSDSPTTEKTSKETR